MHRSLPVDQWFERVDPEAHDPRDTHTFAGRRAHRVRRRARIPRRVYGRPADRVDAARGDRRSEGSRVGPGGSRATTAPWSSGRERCTRGWSVSIPGASRSVRKPPSSPGSSLRPSPTAPRCSASTATSRRSCSRSCTRGVGSGCGACRSTASRTRSRREPTSWRSPSCSRRRGRWRMPQPSWPRPPSTAPAPSATRRRPSGGCRSRHPPSTPRCATRTSGCAPRAGSRSSPSRRIGICGPIHAGWYAGADPWASCYGGAAVLADDARRYDLSPAWQAFVGAEPAIELFAGLDPRRCTTTRRGWPRPSGRAWA